MKIEAIKEIEETLIIEKQSFLDGGEQDQVIKGWIEALDYTLRVIKMEG